MTREELTEQKVQELFRTPAAGEEGTDGELMQILQRYIFGELCYTGSLDNRMRELVTITALTTIQALPQLKAHLGACLNVGCTPVELRETIYQCAPFIGFPKTLNGIGVLNEVLTAAGTSLPLPKQGTVAEGERYEKGWISRSRCTGTRLRTAIPGCPSPLTRRYPRFLTEHCFGDFSTRTGLDGKTRELLTVIILASLGGAEVQVKKPRVRRPEGREHEGGSGVRPGPRQRLHGHPPAVQRPEHLQRSADRRIKNIEIGGNKHGTESNAKNRLGCLGLGQRWNLRRNPHRREPVPRV